MTFKLNLFTQIQNITAPKAPVFKAESRSNQTFAFEPINDGFSTNPIYSKIGSEAEIVAMAKSNPNIMAILKEHNLPLKINMQAIEDMI